LDGAHNPAGARALAESLAAYFGDTPMTLVFGVLRDKDAPGILAPLLERTRRVVLTASANPRAASPDELRRLVPSAVPVDVVQSVGDALACAADPAVSLVCVAGSLSSSEMPCARSPEAIHLVRSKSRRFEHATSAGDDPH